jgi:collagen type IV alpha-3-binding protein
MEQLSYAKAGVEEGVWQLFADEGQMKMYKRDLEIDGMVCDPLKAVHFVKVIWILWCKLNRL